MTSMTHQLILAMFTQGVYRTLKVVFRDFVKCG